MKNLKNYIVESIINEDTTITIGKFVEEISGYWFSSKIAPNYDEFISTLTEPYCEWELNGKRVNIGEPDKYQAELTNIIIKNYKEKVRVKKTKDKDAGTRTWEFDLGSNHITCIMYQ
jgi:hypothetical protein